MVGCRTRPRGWLRRRGSGGGEIRVRWPSADQRPCSVHARPRYILDRRRPSVKGDGSSPYADLVERAVSCGSSRDNVSCCRCHGPPRRSHRRVADRSGVCRLVDRRPSLARGRRSVGVVDARPSNTWTTETPEVEVHDLRPRGSVQPVDHERRRRTARGYAAVQIGSVELGKAVSWPRSLPDGLSIHVSVVLRNSINFRSLPPAYYFEREAMCADRYVRACCNAEIDEGSTRRGLYCKTERTLDWVQP